MTEYFGTENAGGEPSLTIDQRLTRCYELAGYALTLGTAPRDATLIHGTWQHIAYAAQRIGHAWLELPDGDIWEPIQGVIWPRDVWETVLQPITEARYTRTEAHNAIVFFRNWGRWHDSDYE